MDSNTKKTLLDPLSENNPITIQILRSEEHTV